jgi:predicted NUDIX family NTP pyrophosphohydrolase
MTRAAPSRESAGLLMFRRASAEVEFFLAHPGGPFWEKRDAGVWTIPKGQPNAGEGLLETAIREFIEETTLEPRGPYLPLGAVRQKAGKTVHAWAFEGDADPAQVQSNSMRLEWPRGSGRWLTFPEIDRCGWFAIEEAMAKLNPAQAEFVPRLIERLGATGPDPE